MSGRALSAAGVVGLLAGLVGVLGVLTGVDLLPTVVLLTALVFVVACAGLALRHFALLVILLLLVRPELDAVGHSSASAVGLIFLAGSGWWLLTRWLADEVRAPAPATWALLAFVATAGLSTLASHLPVVSATATARLAAGALMFVVIEQLVLSRQLPPKVVHLAVAGSAVVVAVHVAVQWATGSAPIDDSTGLARVTGPFVHPSVLGKYAAVVAVLMLARAVWTRTSDRWLWAVGAVVMSGVVLATFTRAAWLALALGVLVLCYRRDHRWLPVIVVTGVLGVLAVPSLHERLVNVWDPGPAPPGAPASSLAWRVGYWQDLLPLGRINPVNGIGLDVVPALRSEGLLPHNVWVQTWVELGLAGVIALVVVVVTMVRTLRRAAVPAVGEGPDDGGEHRAALEAAVGVAVGLLAVTVSENLLDETTTLWYAAAVMASGWSTAARGTDAGGGPDEAAPWWSTRSGWRGRRPRRGSAPASRR